MKPPYVFNFLMKITDLTFNQKERKPSSFTSLLDLWILRLHMDDVQPCHVLGLGDVAIYLPLLFNRVRRLGVYSYLWFMVRITKKYIIIRWITNCKRFFLIFPSQGFPIPSSPFIFRGEEWIRNSNCLGKMGVSKIKGNAGIKMHLFWKKMICRFHLAAAFFVDVNSFDEDTMSILR